MGELVYMLGKLHEMDIFPNILRVDSDNPLLKGRKAHLFYLMPDLSEAVISREPELKELLRAIFITISQEMGVGKKQ